MNQIISFFKKDNQYVFYVVLVAYTLLMIPGLSTIKPILCDEAWYANTAYNFSIGNGFENNIVGDAGNANFVLPLLIAISFKILGTTLFAARIVSVIAGFAFIYSLRLIFKYLEVSHFKQLLAFLIVLAVSFFNSVFRYARPEGVAIACLVGAIYYYFCFVDSRQYKHFIPMAILLYFSFLSHPYTAIFFLCIGVHLFSISIIDKDRTLFFNVIILGLVGVLSVITLLLVNSYFNHHHSLDFIHSNENIIKRTSLRTIKPELLSDRINIFKERYIVSNRIIFSIPLLTVTLLGLFVKNRKIKILTIFSFVHFFLSFFIFKNDLYMFPNTYNYFLAISIIIFPFILDLRILKNKYFFYVIFILFSVGNFAATAYNNFSKIENANQQLSKDLKKHIPINAYTYGPIECWFFVPQSHYISHMYQLGELNMIDFEYVILMNTPADELFSPEKGKFQLEYRSSSKQYGEIELYKRINNTPHN